MTERRWLGLAALVLVAVGGPASAGQVEPGRVPGPYAVDAVSGSPPLSLIEARRAVEAVRRQRVVRALAAVELDNAEIALAWTERAVVQGVNPVEIGHLAHLTRQRAGLAQARAAERRAKQELRALR